jgi:hypothetical protein
MLKYGKHLWQGMHMHRCPVREPAFWNAGVGKTVQAIALAACNMQEWKPLLVICPASLRLLWAEEIEKWLPELRPRDLHLIASSADWRPDLFCPDLATSCSLTPRAVSTDISAAAAEEAVVGATVKIEFEVDKGAKGATGKAGTLHKNRSVSMLQADWHVNKEHLPHCVRDIQLAAKAGSVSSDDADARAGADGDTDSLDARHADHAASHGGCQHTLELHRLRSKDAAAADSAHSMQQDAEASIKGVSHAPVKVKKWRPTAVVCSYTMASILSCLACRARPDAPPCPGFPHCIAAGKYGMVIADESHILRTCNGENGQTAAVRKILASATKAVLLSGTPSVCRPFDIAGQLYALQPQRVGPNFESFKVAFGFRCAPNLKCRLYLTSSATHAVLPMWIRHAWVSH